ncbi:MAG: sigma-54-dependent Fis family transcriptional regulator [Deltaproteobacteria bacterium]|nr:sigma-54-dependent Fis family transcriptional regulator [Deltaproteobacteria bacterium]MDQ3299504.1 sigma-54 dependent transcriptional regulator [Myxococcota bacterium]
MTGSVLLVDDDEDTRTLLCEALRRRGFNVDAVASAQACLEKVRDAVVDLVVTDVQMPGMTGIALCTELHERHPDVLSIVLTGVGDLDTAIAAIRAGAHDFLTKPVKVDALEIAVRRALEHLSVKREVRRLRAAVDQHAPIPGMAGASAVLRETTQLVRRVAGSDATVLITGESGTGKELVARALHELSPRRSEPFVAINCGAMPAPLLESELFGHVRGAFTDAKTSRPGLFLQAGAGTIFLDEVGEMPLEMQVKLLRVLQERTVRPVGGDEEVPFHARVVTATNRDLATEVEELRFREDLFYRVNVVAIPVPPLRDRSGDIPLLARHMLERIAARTNKPAIELSPEAARKLTDYNWPGNVRELENCIERSVAICGRGPIVVEHLPTKVQQYQSARIELASTNAAEMITLDEMERRYVRQVLESLGGNKTHAARVLGIDRRSLYRRLETPPPTTGTPC